MKKKEDLRKKLRDAIDNLSQTNVDVPGVARLLQSLIAYTTELSMDNEKLERASSKDLMSIAVSSAEKLMKAKDVQANDSDIDIDDKDGMLYKADEILGKRVQ